LKYAKMLTSEEIQRIINISRNIPKKLTRATFEYENPPKISGDASHFVIQFLATAAMPVWASR